MPVSIKENVSLPCTNDPVLYEEWPALDVQDYADRARRLMEAVDSSFTHMVFYGDREHFSNIEYFTGYDPRFEEALLIFTRGNEKPMLIVGNEGWGYADKIQIPFIKRKFTPFSLPNQPHDPSVSLAGLFEEMGIRCGSKVALFGWKLFTMDEEERLHRHDVPYYLVKQLFEIVGEENVCTMNHIMLESGKGLRTILEPKELVLAEISGTRTTRAVHRMLAGLRPGMNELEASAGLMIDGFPMSMHPNINFGDSIFYGLASPEPNRILHEGDIACAGMAYRRTLCHKVGVYTAEYDNVPEATRKAYEKYFAAISTWYSSLRIGATGGDVH